MTISRKPFTLKYGATMFLVLGAFITAGLIFSSRSVAKAPSKQEATASTAPTFMTTVGGLGDLDLSFGLDGTVQVDLGNNLNDQAYAVAVQPDGKVVAVGYVSTNSSGKDMAVVRLNPDGSLDTSFNGTGRLSFNFDGSGRDDIAKSVAIQLDGKIVVAGYADVLGFDLFDIALARLNSDGSFDQTFGNSGKTLTNLNNRADVANGMILQPDGKIVVVGYSNRAITGDDFVVVRYNSNGSVDTGFNGTGIVTSDVLTNRADRANAVALQNDGKIVVAGNTSDPNSNNFALVRYNTDGSLDTGFNGTGKVTTDLNINSDDFGNAVALQTDGRIVVAGQSSSDFGIVRYNSNGTLDPSFGGGSGLVTTNFGSGAADSGRGVVILGDGRIVVAGKSRTELAVARYAVDGTLDLTFGTNGRLVQNAGNNQLSPFGGYYGVALQNDGKMVAAGDSWRDFSAIDFSVSRINSDGTYDFTFDGGDGIASTDFVGRDDQVTGVAIQTNGKIVAVGKAIDTSGANRIAIAQYNSNGTLDASFGASGRVMFDIPGYDLENATAMVLQQDGKIVVAAYARDPNSFLDVAFLLRFTASGSLDQSFGTGGLTVTNGSVVNTGNVWLYPRDIAIQPDGRFVVAGLAHYFSAFSDGYVARYSSNGILDNSIASNVPNCPNCRGTMVVDVNSIDDINAVALQGDGKIVVAGYTNDGPTGDMLIARLTASGTFDTTFHGNGKLTVDFGGNTFDQGLDVAIQLDGKIVAVGRTDINFIDMAVTRLNTDGSFDTSFGDGSGKLHLDINGWGEVASALKLQPDGKIILGGVGDLDRNLSGMAVFRLLPNGNLDVDFGNTGRVITTLGEGVNTGLGQAVNAMALQSDGKIILAGTSGFNSTGGDFVLVRYLGALTHPTSTPTPTPTGTPISCQPVSSNVLSWWRAEGSAADFYGVNNGSLQKGTAFATGIVGEAFSFDGINDSVVINRSIQDDFTIEFWIKTTLVAGSGNQWYSGQGLVDGEVSGTTNDFGISLLGGKVLFGTGNPDVTIMSSFIADGGWHHVAATRIRSTGALRLYVDGTQVASGNAGTQSLTAPPRLVLGRIQVDTNAFQGKMDELSIYDRALTISEVQSIFVAQTSGKCTGSTPTPTLQFGASNYTPSEDIGSCSVTVTRAGATSGPATVNYSTSDNAGTDNCNALNSGNASSRCDYETTSGTVQFAAGEISKTILIPIVDDAYAEGSESLVLTLSNANGASLGTPSLATVTIVDNEATTGTNPVNSPNFFVRLHYVDFFTREPDPGGFAFWTNQITSCGLDQACVDVRRINVSAAFYLSIEFQGTGYLVERLYKTAYGNANGTSTFGGTHNLAVPIVRFNEFLPDTQEIGRGVVVGQPGWEQVLENNKQAFLLSFVQRARFTTAFPVTMTAPQFVDAMNNNAGNVLSSSERAAAIGLFGGATDTSNITARAQSLRQVAEDTDLSSAESNRAFVLMQYFGYLRRNPNEGADSDHTGYDFWLTKLNQFNGNFINAEMVKAFILSGEYKQRFGP